MIDYEHRWREAIVYAQKAEQEIKRLRARVAELEEATVILAATVDGTVEALEMVTKGHGYQA